MEWLLMYKVKYYAENNNSPVVEFIENQPPKEQAKILREIRIWFVSWYASYKKIKGI